MLFSLKVILLLLFYSQLFQVVLKLYSYLCCYLKKFLLKFCDFFLFIYWSIGTNFHLQFPSWDLVERYTVGVLLRSNVFFVLSQIILKSWPMPYIYQKFLILVHILNESNKMTQNWNETIIWFWNCETSLSTSLLCRKWIVSIEIWIFFQKLVLANISLKYLQFYYSCFQLFCLK